jgi:hypothetical protein
MKFLFTSFIFSNASFKYLLQVFSAFVQLSDFSIFSKFSTCFRFQCNKESFINFIQSTQEFVGSIVSINNLLVVDVKFQSIFKNKPPFLYNNANNIDF